MVNPQSTLNRILNIVVLWGCISRKGRGRGRKGGGTDGQPLSDETPLIQCGETYRTSQ